MFSARLSEDDLFMVGISGKAMYCLIFLARCSRPECELVHKSQTKDRPAAVSVLYSDFVQAAECHHALARPVIRHQANASKLNLVRKNLSSLMTPLTSEGPVQNRGRDSQGDHRAGHRQLEQPQPLHAGWSFIPSNSIMNRRLSTVSLLSRPLSSLAWTHIPTR